MKRLLFGGLLIAATGLMLGFGLTEARADMCFGGGRPPEHKDDASAHNDANRRDLSPRKRQLGFGLLAAASVSTVWISLRRRGPGDWQG